MPTEAEDPEPTTEELRVWFAGALLAPATLDVCPPPAEVWDALQGAADPAARAAVVDHVAGCPMCAEAWRLAQRGLRSSAGGG